VLAADHIAEHQEVSRRRCAAWAPTPAASGPSSINSVTLTRHGEQSRCRHASEYVTLDELLDEVGSDAARFFFLSRKSDSHLEFDLELAKKRSTDKPVLLRQYAHARIMSLYAQAVRKASRCRARPSPRRRRGIELAESSS